MPKEYKKRGRREDKKKRKWEEENGPAHRAKRQKSLDAVKDFDIIANEGLENGPYSAVDTLAGLAEPPFYGLLDDNEQEYFKRADSMLEVNQFGDAEERDLFLSNVYKEANGKELKIANSQSCSRLMERLILLSNPEQLKTIFQKFSGHFLNLVQHRFASHCCEALFLRAAPIVSLELLSATAIPETGVYVTMENQFLYTVNELEPNLGYLMSDLFASHPLRVLLVVLSGMPLAASNTRGILQSKKKENVSVAESSTASRKDALPRVVPPSFHDAIDKILTSTLIGLEGSYLRALASQPLANPVLQIMLKLELTRSGKEKAKEAQSLFRKLLPDDPLVEGTESAAFIKHLLYDPVGSRLLEVIITHAPGKTFKAIYRGLLKEKLGIYAKNEIAAFVVIKLIERLGKDDLGSAMEHICPHFNTLIKASRTAVIKALIERCRARGVDIKPIADTLQQLYGGKNAGKLTDILQEASGATVSPERKSQLESHNVSNVHASLLTQVMLEVPGPLRELVNSSLLTIEPSALKIVAKDRTASRVIQAALTCTDPSIKFRRLFVQRFIGSVAELASDVVASHVVDSLWDGSSGLKFLRERIADELMDNESLLRASMPGRAVWRNWKLDLYKARRREWWEGGIDPREVAKTRIQLARERHAIRTVGRQLESAGIDQSQTDGLVKRAT
ncbi:MAG: hypothetical protein Q9163_001053 [Psora crenata]